MRYRIEINPQGKLRWCHNPDYTHPDGRIGLSAVPPTKDNQIPWDDVPQLVKDRMLILDCAAVDPSCAIRGIGVRYSVSLGLIYFIHDTELPCQSE
jgi:hypothetical protein